MNLSVTISAVRFEAQDKVDEQREELIAKIEGKLMPHTAIQELFVFRWSVMKFTKPHGIRTGDFMSESIKPCLTQAPLLA